MKKQTHILFLIIFGIFIVVQSFGAMGDVTDGLVAYYPFDGNAIDASGNNNNGIEYGGLEYKLGIKGAAASFDGVNDYIRVPSHPSLNPINQLSISFWVKVDGFTNTWSPIVHKGGPSIGNGNNRKYSVWLQDTSSFLLASAGNNSAQIYNYACCARMGSWSHYLGIIDRQNHRMKLYVDGVLRTDSADSYSTFNNNLADLIIGWTEEVSSSYSPFKGRIDELRIYNRALSENEVKALYDELSPTSLIYFNDFSGAVGSKWSSTSVATTPVGARKFLGVFSNSYAQLTLPSYPEGDVTVNFDLFVLQSWDGNGTYCCGPDLFTLQGDNNNLLRTTFDNTGLGARSQSFPGNYFSSYVTRYGALESNTLGYSYYGDSVYTITKTFHHAQGNILVGFMGSNLEGWPNEGWGLDNVRIYFQPAFGSMTNLVGKTLRILSSYEFSLEQHTQKNVVIQLTNPSSDSQSATLEVINTHAELTISPTQPTPITLAPGETKDIPLTINAGATPVGTYDDLLLKLTLENGETIYSNVKVTVVVSGSGNLPDLTINSQDIQLADYTLGQTATLKAVVHNTGLSPASNVQVQFYEFGNLLGTTVLAQVPSNGIGSASITVPMAASGDHLVRVVVDPSGAIQELDKTNNEASQIVQPGGPSPVSTAGNILVTGSLPTTVYTDSLLFTLSGRAAYDITVGGVRYTNYVVKGGAVQITISADGGASWVYGDVHTDVNGNFSKFLQAPASPGTYRISMTVTDQTFSGTRELVFSVVSPPPPHCLQFPLPPDCKPIQLGDYHQDPIDWPYVIQALYRLWQYICPNNQCPPGAVLFLPNNVYVYSADIYFSKNNPASNETIPIWASIHYSDPIYGSCVHNVPVNFYVTYPGTPKVKIGQTTVPGICVGSPQYAYTTWKNNQGDSIYLVEAEIDPSYVELNLLDNAATRAIIVGQVQSGLGVVSGQVINPSGGVGNVVMHVFDASGTTEIGNTFTDQTGFYLVKDVPLGEVQVRINPPIGYQPDTLMKTVTVSAQSVNTADFLLAQQVDTTPPVITPTVSGTLGNNGWYTSNVTVSWAVVDDESAITSKVDCDPATVTTDTPGVTFICSATSSGGTTSKSVTIQRDATPPTITGSANPAANANGWNNNAVTASFACHDATSVIATCTAAQTLSEGANQSVSGTATDNAGNTASTQVTGINVDLMAPVVSVTGVTNGATYTLGSVPAAGCMTTDALSRVQTSATLSVTGGNANGGGTFTASCTGAMDKAGNPGAASVTYQVNSALTGDIDGNGVVNCADIMIVKGAFGKRTGQAGFDPRADTNADGVVDIRDLSMVARQLPAGTQCP